MRYIAVARDDRATVRGQVHLVTEAEANRYRRRPEGGHDRKRYIVHAICTRGVAFPVFEDWDAHPDALHCKGCAARAAEE